MYDKRDGFDFVIACVHGSTNGTNGIPISFKVLPMAPLVMVPLVKTIGSKYCRQSTVWAKLTTLKSHMFQYGVFYENDIRKQLNTVKYTCIENKNLTRIYVYETLCPQQL